MVDTTVYAIGERVYELDSTGSILIVGDRYKKEKELSEKCEAVSDKTLNSFRDKKPSVTLTVELLKEIISSFDCEFVHVFIGAPNEPVLFVQNDKKFAVLMPRNPGADSLNMPKPAKGDAGDSVNA